MLRKFFSVVAILVFSICCADEPSDKKTAEEFMAEQIEFISALSQAIDTTNSCDDLLSLGLYTQRGISYFLAGELENALDDFNHVLTRSQSGQTSERELLGTALWGRLFCHAFGSQLQETREDSQSIQLLFLDRFCEVHREGEEYVKVHNLKDDVFVVPAALFANPGEQITKGECSDRRQSIADKMRSLADRVPLSEVRAEVFFAINQLSDRAYACCQRGIEHWTACLTPIVDAWKKLDDDWDQLVDLHKKGVKIAPFVRGAGK
jgi:hypothetical protein